MNIKEILISQPEPLAGSPYTELVSKFGISITFFPFFRIEPLTLREFRTQRINIPDYTAIVFTAKSSIDAFFKLCEELRITVPESLKYFCLSEAVALYLQKYIVYRKRKIFFGNGTISSIIDAIGTKHKDETFLLTCADNGKSDLAKLFSKTKLTFSSAVLIKTVFSDLSKLNIDKYQMLVFYSPSDIKSLMENFPDFEQKELLFATYGQSTSKAMKSANLNVAIQAPTPEAPSIAKALMLYFSNNKK